MSDEIKRLDLAPSVHGVVNHLNAELERGNLSELYVVVRDKDGTFYTCLSGDISGLSFAILVLQDHALRTLQR